jgi:single-strand DNA-binding protein
MRYTPTGQAVTNLNVATSRRWTDRDGNQQEETIWWRVAVWGKQAEVCNQYLSKGRPVLIEARVRPDPATGGPRIWTGNDGQPRASYELNALSVRFLGGRGETAEPSAEEGEAPPDLNEDELPF